MYINTIKSPQDVKRLTTDQLCVLADEIRQALLAKLSVHGGHVGPNLGMVEATIALHYVFDSPHDKIVYDVSHQSYVHKMLTGRKDAFLHAEEYDEVTGYTNPRESKRTRLFHRGSYLDIGKSGLRTGKSQGLGRQAKQRHCRYRRRFFERW